MIPRDRKIDNIETLPRFARREFVAIDAGPRIMKPQGDRRFGEKR